jgi:hypothetical protein
MTVTERRESEDPGSIREDPFTIAAMTERPRPPAWLFPVLAVWFIAAFAVGYIRLLERVSIYAAPVIIWSLVALQIAVFVASHRLRDWLWEVDLRALIALHISRFVGIAFLMMANRGVLPEEWAKPAGEGDIAVAATAVLVITALSFERVRFPRSVMLWNVFGFADILMVVISAIRLIQVNPAAFKPMTVLPMSLLPTFLVPLIISTHLFLFFRIWREMKIERAANDVAEE